MGKQRVKQYNRKIGKGRPSDKIFVKLKKKNQLSKFQHFIKTFRIPLSSTIFTLRHRKEASRL